MNMMRCKNNIRLLLCVLLLNSVIGIDVEVKSGSQSVYVRMCFSNVDDALDSVHLRLWDWTDLDAPVRVYEPMRTSSPTNCYEYSPPSSSISLIWVPATIRLEGQTYGRLDMVNALTSLQVGHKFSHPGFLDEKPTSYPPDRSLVAGNEVYGPFNAAVTYFDIRSNGNCMFGDGSATGVPPAYHYMFVAIREQEWNSAGNCGRCVKITNTEGTSAEFMVADKCPIIDTPTATFNPCSRYHWMDISENGFALLGDTTQGVIQVKWEYVYCRGIRGTIQYRLRYWAKDYGYDIQIYNHIKGVEKVWVKPTSASDSEYVELLRGSTTNYFRYNSTREAAMKCPCTLRIRAYDGEVLVDSHTISSRIGDMPKEQYFNSGIQFTLPRREMSSMEIAVVVFSVIWLAPMLAFYTFKSRPSPEWANFESVMYMASFIRVVDFRVNSKTNVAKRHVDRIIDEVRVDSMSVNNDGDDEKRRRKLEKARKKQEEKKRKAESKRQKQEEAARKKLEKKRVKEEEAKAKQAQKEKERSSKRRAVPQAPVASNAPSSSVPISPSAASTTSSVPVPPPVSSSVPVPPPVNLSVPVPPPVRSVPAAPAATSSVPSAPRAMLASSPARPRATTQPGRGDLLSSIRKGKKLKKVDKSKRPPAKSVGGPGAGRPMSIQDALVASLNARRKMLQ